MNRIHMELVQTIYDYGEYYWMIDGRPIVRYLNEAVSAGACPRLEVFGSLEGLLPAWTGELCGRLKTVLSGSWWIHPRI